MFPLFSTDSTRAYCDKLLKDAHSQSVFHGTAQATGESVGVAIGSAITVSYKTEATLITELHSSIYFRILLKTALNLTSYLCNR